MQQDPLVSAASLHGVAATCLIPLALRAQDARSASPLLGDARAVEIASRVDCDWSNLRLPDMSARAALLRAREIDRRIEELLARPGRVAIVSIGSGLDTRMSRLSRKPAVWIDLDLPEVAALRKALIPDEDPARTIQGSFLEAGWLREVKAVLAGARIVLVAEGVLNYLPRSPLALALNRVSEELGPSVLLGDVMSRAFAAAARFLGAIRSTGADLEWGASSRRAVERLLPVRVLCLDAYLDPDDAALGSGRALYRLPCFRGMSRLLVAEVGAPAPIR